MSEKVLGFKEKDLSRIKFSDTSKIFVRVPESSLISVVSVEWLKKWCKEEMQVCDRTEDFDRGVHDILESLLEDIEKEKQK